MGNGKYCDGYLNGTNSMLLVLFASSVILQLTSASSSSDGILKMQNCCNEGDFYTSELHSCHNGSNNETYKTPLNCSTLVVIEHDDSHVAHENPTGSLDFGDFEVAWEDYCLAVQKTNESEQVLVVCLNAEHYESHLTISLMMGVMMLISVFFLAITLYIYNLIPDLRETTDRVTSIAVACLMLFMLLLGLVQLGTVTNPTVCEMIGFPMYFFLISYFAWLNVVMANVWKSTVARRWKIMERTWYVLNHIYAHSVAITLTFIVFVYHMSNATFGEGSCWFSTPEEQHLFVYLPLTIMLSINIILFVWTSYHLHKSGDDISPDRKKALRYKCMLYLKLFLLAGLIWIFEIISFHAEQSHLHRSWIWPVIDSINCLHGVLVFLVLIVWRQRIKRELSGRWILCFRGPASWSNLRDDEQEQLADNDREPGKYDLIIK